MHGTGNKYTNFGWPHTILGLMFAGAFNIETHQKKTRASKNLLERARKYRHPILPGPLT
jgi:hypothetical protein